MSVLPPGIDRRGLMQLEGVGAGHVLNLRQLMWAAIQGNPQVEATPT